MDEKSKQIRKLKREITRLKRLVIKDELTGVLNRRGVESEMGVIFKEVHFLKENPQSRHNFRIDDLSVIFVDIDNFKEINDKFGHHVGDTVLRWLCVEIRRKIRNVDILGRLGGDEFIVGLIGADEDTAYKKAEEIRKEVRAKKIIEKHKNLSVTISLGISSAKKTRAKSVEDLISTADRAMYKAKFKYNKDFSVKFSEVSK